MPRLKCQKGFTLFELVMVIMIIGIISVVIAKTMLQGFISFSTAQNTSEVEWQAFLALERITDDIHNIRNAASITTTTATQFNFVDASGVSVQYSLSGTSLLRNSQVLSNNTTGLIFLYYDANLAAPAVPSNTRYIGVFLTLTEGNISTTFLTFIGTRGLA